MILRRIREHVETHNWFAVAIDLVIVVVGVFLGTQANNWNQERIDRASASGFRREIIDDLKSNEVDMQSREAYYRAVKSHALRALSEIEGPPRPLSEPFLIDAYQASQVWLRPLVRTGYDKMTAAGLSGGIGDNETQSRLTAYYSQIRQFDITALNSTSYRERLRRVMPYAVQRAAQRRCGDRITTLLSGAQVADLPESCTLGLDRPIVALAVSRLQAARLGEDLTRHIADIDQKLAGFDRFRALAHQNRLALERVDPR